MPSREIEALRRTVEATRTMRLRQPPPLDDLDEVEAQAEAAARRAPPPIGGSGG